MGLGLSKGLGFNRKSSESLDPQNPALNTYSYALSRLNPWISKTQNPKPSVCIPGPLKSLDLAERHRSPDSSPRMALQAAPGRRAVSAQCALAK
jgi:hypothetical protein